MMKIVRSFPSSLPTELLTQFYRVRNTIRVGGDLVSVAGESKVSRFPYKDARFPMWSKEGIESMYDYGQHTVSSNPFFVGGVEYLEEPKEPIHYTNKEVLGWIESEYPIHNVWDEGEIIALLPEVEIPPLFFNRGQMYAAVNMNGELGVVCRSVRDSYVMIDFDDTCLDDFKIAALTSGWQCIEYETHLLNDPPVIRANLSGHHDLKYFPRVDDGHFDQKTFAFWVGSRCKWCGSSSLTPPFLGERGCVACKTVGEDNVSSDNFINLNDLV